VLDQLANGEKALLERIGLSMAIQCLTVMSSLCSRSAGQSTLTITELAAVH
jgi:hypothetical protein